MIAVRKSSYDVAFLRDTWEKKEYVLKGFQSYGRALRDIQKETRGHSLVSESSYVVKAIEFSETDKVPVAPRPIYRELPGIFRTYSYNYILMPRIRYGSLLEFLMKANYNNGTGIPRKLSMKTQRYLCRQVAEAVYYMHQVD